MYLGVLSWCKEKRGGGNDRASRSSFCGAAALLIFKGEHMKCEMTFWPRTYSLRSPVFFGVTPSPGEATEGAVFRSQAKGDNPDEHSVPPTPPGDLKPQNGLNGPQMHELTKHTRFMGWQVPAWVYSYAFLVLVKRPTRASQHS